MAKSSFPPARANTRAALVETVWDLRDRAYDNPDLWRRINAEQFFQALAETLEDEENRPGRLGEVTWQEIVTSLRAAADRAESGLDSRPQT